MASTSKQNRTTPPASTSAPSSADSPSGTTPPDSPPSPTSSPPVTTASSDTNQSLTSPTDSTVFSTPFTTTQTTAATTSKTTQSAAAAAVSNSTSVNDGAIAGGVVGGTLFLALLILGIILCRRARRKKHMAPSSEFAKTIERGEMPVLRLDSGVEIVPTTPLHVPLPLQQDSYRTSLPMSDMKFPDGMMWSEAQSTRYSLQKPLQPLRYPVHKDSDDSMMHPGHTKGSSTDDSQEYWSGESGNVDTRKGFASQSPDPGYLPLMQNTYPVEHSNAVETVENAYGNPWELSVAPTTPSRPSSGRYNEDGQALPPLIPVRRSVDVHTLPPLVPVRRSVDMRQR